MELAVAVGSDDRCFAIAITPAYSATTRGGGGETMKAMIEKQNLEHFAGRSWGL